MLPLSLSAEQPKSAFNQEVKRKIQWEIKGMQNDMLQLDITMRNLKEDKLEIQRALDNVKEWGIAQQKEKLEYYNNATQLSDQLSSANTKLLDSEKVQQELRERYQRIKRMLSYTAGALLFLLFIRFGNLIAPLAGAYGPIVVIGGPFAAFTLGYLLVKFIL